MNTIKGDMLKLALDGQFDVIVHGCNCFHTMGAGIAKSIASKFPEAFEADKLTEYGSSEKLGSLSIGVIERGSVKFTVINAYTQFQWRGRGRKVDYEAISKCFGTISELYPTSRIAYPMIGAGLAGGDWDIIQKLIVTELTGLDHTLVLFDG